MIPSNFMLLATAWGARHGGINAFNRDFAVGLATALGTDGTVFCAVISSSGLRRVGSRR